MPEARNRIVSRGLAPPEREKGQGTRKRTRDAGKSHRQPCDGSIISAGSHVQGRYTDDSVPRGAGVGVRVDRSRPTAVSHARGAPRRSRIPSGWAPAYRHVRHDAGFGRLRDRRHGAVAARIALPQRRPGSVRVRLQRLHLVRLLRNMASACHGRLANSSRRASDVPVGALEAGDLVFFSTSAPGASHVGMAIGGDEFVHAPSVRGEVRVERFSSSYWAGRMVGARRIR